MAYTVAQAFAELLQRKKELSDVPSSLFLVWANYCNRYFYRQVTNIMPESYLKTQVYNVVSGVESYTLPTDFQDIIPAGTGLYEISNAGVNTSNRTAITNFGSTRNGFYLNLTSIIFTPKPTNSKSYNFRYIPLLADLTGESSVFLIPDRFSEHLMNVLDRCYAIWDETGDAEAFNDERIRASLDEIVSLINPIGQTYGLPAMMEDYYYDGSSNY